MIKVGITGQNGFIGMHLFNTLGLSPKNFERIGFENSFFQDIPKLEAFVSKCDVIVHLAAMNRHQDPSIIYETNVWLVSQLIAACVSTHSKPHILFASSTQEERDNLYGRSKKEGRKLFEQWANNYNAYFTGLIIPNVFGPFGHPYYNSVVATFCHQLTHGETPKIEVDSEIKLIYVTELVNELIHHINAVNEQKEAGYIETIQVRHTGVIRVSFLLEKLKGYAELYLNKGIIPRIEDSFDRNLFNTFLCYVDHKSFFPFYFQLHSDQRGSFVEIIKLHSGGQVSFSTTAPGVTRGNHFHTRKAERFAIIKGKARVDIRRIGTNDLITFKLDGDNPSFVDMPIWHTHNITNVGEEELYTIFWINEHYDSDDPDTYFEKV